MKQRLPSQASNDSVAALVILMLVAAVGGLELGQGLPIATGGLANLAVASGVMGLGALFYRRVRPREHLAASCMALFQALIFSAAGEILSYLLARKGGVLWDATLLGWDRALGLDWIAYASFVDARPWLAEVLKLAYGSLIPQVVVVIVGLGFARQLDQLRAVILAAILAGTAAVLLSPLFPAVGNFAHLGLRPSDFHHIWPWAGLADVRDFLALRSGSLAQLDLRTMQGIIVFPSYHAALAVVMLWGFWSSRIAALRWVGTLLCSMTIIATPVFGGHYFVDVIAGAFLAVAGIAAARRLIFVRIPLPAVRAWPFRRSRAAFAR